MTADQRSIAERLRADLRAALDSAGLPEAHNARLAVVAKMLLAYPVANANAETGAARGEAYLDGLDDVPPWALQAAAKAWNRGEGGGNHDFAPSPSRLRALALSAMGPYTAAVAHLDDLLNALPAERAMDPKPVPAPDSARALIPNLRRIK